LSSYSIIRIKSTFSTFRKGGAKAKDLVLPFLKVVWSQSFKQSLTPPFLKVDFLKVEWSQSFKQSLTPPFLKVDFLKVEWSQNLSNL